MQIARLSKFLEDYKELTKQNKTQKHKCFPGMMAHSCNLSIKEAEVGKLP